MTPQAGPGPNFRPTSRAWFEEDVIRSEVELPVREFMYTLDQIAYMLDCTTSQVQKFLYYRGRDSGTTRGRIIATNISPPDQAPEWRVSENSFIMWLRSKRIHYYGGRMDKAKQRKVPM